MYLTSSNEAKHGCVLSPILCSFYIDCLQQLLRNSRYPRHLKVVCMGVVAHANNVTTICLSRHGLNIIHQNDNM